MLVTGTEESRGTAEQALAAPVPADAPAGLEGLRNLGLVEERRRNQVANGPHENRAVLIGKRKSLLRPHRKLAGLCVVVDITRSGLRRQPFADIAFGGVGCLCKLRRVHRTLCG